MTIQRDIEKVELKGNEWVLRKPTKNIKLNVGWDSETIEGKPFLMANSNLKGINHLYSDDILEYLDFLTMFQFRSTNNFWFNLDYDIAALVKLLPHDIAYELTYNNSTEYEGFKLKYIINKMFRITKDGLGSTHYDISQFYNKQPLKDLAHKTSYDKVKVDDISNIDLKRVKNDPIYHKLITDRCLIDARMTKELSDQFTDKSNMVVKNNRYLSVASIARAYFLTNLTKRLKLPSKRIMDYGLKSFHGGWIEALKLGTFKKAFNIDIVSAYPSVMANLYSCNGIWSTRINETRDTVYSFYKANIDFYDDNISPLWFNHKNKDYHPNGEIEITITGLEYDWFISKGFNVDIISATHLLKSKNHEQPFNQLIHSLFDKRRVAKDNEDEIEQIYKLILNSAYGCTINDVEKIVPCTLNEWEHDGSNPWHIYDINDETIFYIVKNLSTSMYNPVFASYITAGCRVQLLNTLWKHRDKVISINTDGAYLKSKIPIKNSKKLGEWSFKQYNQLMVMGNGRYFVYDKDGILNTKQSAFRGLRSAKKNMPIVDQQIKDKPDTLGIEIEYTRPLKLKECVKTGNYDGINIFTDKRTNISFILDRRLWENEIMTNNDLIDNQINSMPLTTNEIIK